MGYIRYRGLDSKHRLWALHLLYLVAEFKAKCIHSATKFTLITLNPITAYMSLERASTAALETPAAPPIGLSKDSRKL